MAIIGATNTFAFNSQNNRTTTSVSLGDNDSPSVSRTLQRISTVSNVDTSSSGSLLSSTKLFSKVQSLENKLLGKNENLALSRLTGEANKQLGKSLLELKDLAKAALDPEASSNERQALQAKALKINQTIEENTRDVAASGNALLNGLQSQNSFRNDSSSLRALDLNLEAINFKSLGKSLATNNSLTERNYESTYTIKSYNTDVNEGFNSVTVPLQTATPNTANAIVSQELTLNGFFASETVSIEGGATAEEITYEVNSLLPTTGIAAEAVTELSFSDLDSSGTLSLAIATSGTAAFTSIQVDISDPTNLTVVVDAFNKVSDETGIAATFGKDSSEIVLTQADGKNIVINDFSLSDGTGSAKVLPVGISGNVRLGPDTGEAIVVTGRVELSSSRSFTVSSDQEDGKNVFANLNSDVQIFSQKSQTSNQFKLNDEDNLLMIDLSSADGAKQAAAIVSRALEAVQLLNANLNTTESRLEIAPIGSNSDSNFFSNGNEGDRPSISSTIEALDTAGNVRDLFSRSTGESLLVQANASPGLTLSLLVGFQ